MKYRRIFMPLFDPEDTGGAEVEGSDGQVANTGLISDAAEQPKTIQDILANAPLVGGNDDSDGNQQQEQPANPDSKAPETPEQSEVTILDFSKPFKIKLDDTEIDPDMFKTAWKDHNDKANWVKRHTQESQLMNFYHKNMSDTERDRFLAYGIAHAMGKQDLPKDFKVNPIEFELDVTLNDEMGEEVKGKHKHTINPDSDQYKALRDQFYQQFMQEHEPVFRELKQSREERETFEQQVTEWQEKAASDDLRGFIKNNGYNIPIDGNVRETLEEIFSAGKTHPNYSDVNRLLKLAQIANTNGISLAEAHAEMYGEQQAKAKANDVLAKDRAKQAKAQPLKPNGAPVQTDTEKFIGQFSNPVDKQINDLWSGKLG